MKYIKISCTHTLQILKVFTTGIDENADFNYIRFGSALSFQKKQINPNTI